MVTQMQRDNSEIAYILWTVVRNKIYQRSKVLTILAGLAISCLKLILLNKDLSCLLSGLLHLDDIKQQLKSPVRIVSFPWTAAQAKIMSSLVINWLS